MAENDAKNSRSIPHQKALNEFPNPLLQIELLFLPPYSPNLNLIERLWRFIKKECLYAKYYEDFAQFKQAIEGSLAEAGGIHKEELATLCSLKFQSFADLIL